MPTVWTKVIVNEEAGLIHRVKQNNREGHRKRKTNRQLPRDMPYGSGNAPKKVEVRVTG